LRAKITGYIDEFVFEKLDTERSAYSNISFQEFMNTFEISEELLQEYAEFFSKMSGRRIYIEKYADQMKRHIKAVFIEQLYGTNGYQQQLNVGDAMIEKVLELHGN